MDYKLPSERTTIDCAQCPRCKDVYPDKVDAWGYHFCICGMSGNMVYTTPHRMRKANGKGWIKFSSSGCGLYETVEDALKDMTESEIRRWREDKHDRT